MKTPLDKDLNKVYEPFKQNHNHLRQKLMASLPDRSKQHTWAGRISHLLAYTGETIMKNRITQLAAAAVIIIAIVLSIIFLDKSVTTVYAIEQTIEANRTMRYLHLRYFDSSHGDVAKECWLEFDETGQATNVRINWSEWMAGGEIVVWNKDKTQILNKKRNFLITFNDEIYTARVLTMARRENPRLTVERLYERQAKGEVEIEIEQPASKAEPIVVTATGLGGNTMRFVLFVDQATNLVTSLKWFQLKNGEYKYQGVMEYHDYNIPIGANVFSLDDEVPGDIKIIDTRVQDVGLAQSNLSNEEIATKVVREFLEALIVKDYTKAAQISGVLSPKKIKQGWGKLKVVRIVSIDEPTPPAKPSKLFPNCQHVLCTIEIEKNGKEVQQQLKSFKVRPVLGRRERWVFH
ncbi:MAG: hypothetical protein HQ580_16025 [Planctomycetes bacterium]|nr:hypothetical protein [Planctomycetota bacterium]